MNVPCGLIASPFSSATVIDLARRVRRSLGIPNTFSTTNNNGQIFTQTHAPSGEAVRERQRRDGIVAMGEGSKASATRGKVAERSETTSHAPQFGACDTTIPAPTPPAKQ